MSIGFCPEDSGAIAEHLGLCREFYVDFQSHDGIVLRNYLVEVEDVIYTGASHVFQFR